MGSFRRVKVPSNAPEEVFIGLEGLLVVTGTDGYLIRELKMALESSDVGVLAALRELIYEYSFGAVECATCEAALIFILTEGVKCIFEWINRDRVFFCAFGEATVSNIVE